MVDKNLIFLIFFFEKNLKWTEFNKNLKFRRRNRLDNEGQGDDCDRPNDGVVFNSLSLESTQTPKIEVI